MQYFDLQLKWVHNVLTSHGIPVNITGNKETKQTSQKRNLDQVSGKLFLVTIFYNGSSISSGSPCSF